MSDDGSMSPRRRKQQLTTQANSDSLIPGGDPIERIRNTPKESLIQRANSPRRQQFSSPGSNLSKEISLELLPRIKDATDSAMRAHLIKTKIGQCAYLCQFDAFDDPTSGSGSTEALTDGTGSSSSRRSSIATIFISPNEVRNREIKKQNIFELIELITTVPNPIPDQFYSMFFQMIIKNIFRPIPPPFNPSGEAFDPAEDEPVLEPSWPHLQLIYELLIRFLESPDFNSSLARKFVDPLFIVKLLSLFDVEDPRERDLLKTTLHRIYAKFLPLRALIRKSIHNIFYEFVEDSTVYRHNISEMLEILGSIINGFALPLKEEHILFLEKTLIPLHKTRYLPLYFRQLSYCIIQFVDKDARLSICVVKGLLKLWPKTNSMKEVMFLNEIEDILDLTPIEIFSQISSQLFTQLAKCIDSNHFQVAERSLMFWHNEHIFKLIQLNVSTVLPIVLPVLSRHSKSHWNRNVQGLVLNALDCFMEMDGSVFDDCVAKLTQQKEEEEEKRRNKLNCWIELDKIVSDKKKKNLNSNSNCSSFCSRDDADKTQLYSLLTSDDSYGHSLLQQDQAEEGVENITNIHQEELSSIISEDKDKDNNNNNDKKTIAQNQTRLNTRRKSILPVDVNIFEQLATFSRSPSPQFEDEKEDEDKRGDEKDRDKDKDKDKDVEMS